MAVTNSIDLWYVASGKDPVEEVLAVSAGGGGGRGGEGIVGDVAHKGHADPRDGGERLLCYQCDGGEQLPRSVRSICLGPGHVLHLLSNY